MMTAQIPQLDRLAQSSGGQEFVVRGVGDRLGAVGWSVHLADRRAHADFPESNFVILAPGCEPVAIRRQGDGQDFVVLPWPPLPLLSRSGIPEADGRVGACG